MNLNHEFNGKFLLNFKNVNFVPLVPDVSKIVSSIWNNTSLIKSSYKSKIMGSIKDGRWKFDTTCSQCSQNYAINLEQHLQLCQINTL